jgi:penicillin-binding protein 2
MLYANAKELRSIHCTVGGTNQELINRVFDIIADGMANAVTSGTCRAANLGTDIQVCGKTGTAENPHGEDHSLFMAFAPKNDPEVAIAVVVENGGFGARNAVPIGRLMLQKYFRDSIPESDKWIEEQIASREILPFVYQKNAIIKGQSANVNQ